LSCIVSSLTQLIVVTLLIFFLFSPLLSLIAAVILVFMYHSYPFYILFSFSSDVRFIYLFCYLFFFFSAAIVSVDVEKKSVASFTTIGSFFPAEKVRDAFVFSAFIIFLHSQKPLEIKITDRHALQQDEAPSHGTFLGHAYFRPVFRHLRNFPLDFGNTALAVTDRWTPTPRTRFFSNGCRRRSLHRVLTAESSNEALN
jgi:hypothetical protein